MAYPKSDTHDPLTSPHGGFATPTASATATPTTATNSQYQSDYSQQAQQGGFGQGQIYQGQQPGFSGQGQQGGFVGGVPVQQGRCSKNQTACWIVVVLYCCCCLLPLLAVMIIIPVFLFDTGSSTSSSSSSSDINRDHMEYRCRNVSGIYKCDYESVYYDMALGPNGSYVNSTT